MATFRVNQRVRIARCVTGSAREKFIGMQTIITGPPDTNWMLKVLAYPVAIDDGKWGFQAHELEPIIDSGRTVVEFEVGVSPWVPEHLRDKAGSSEPTETPTV